LGAVVMADKGKTAVPSLASPSLAPTDEQCVAAICHALVRQIVRDGMFDGIDGIRVSFDAVDDATLAYMISGAAPTFPVNAQIELTWDDRNFFAKALLCDPNAYARSTLVGPVALVARLRSRMSSLCNETRTWLRKEFTRGEQPSASRILVFSLEVITPPADRTTTIYLTARVVPK
jgi:hypothetical protein